MREISIRPALNGYICQVGCQQVVFESRTSLITSLDRYLTDPGKVEHEFITKAVNRTPIPEPVREPLLSPAVRNIIERNVAAECGSTESRKSPKPLRD